MNEYRMPFPGKRGEPMSEFSERCASYGEYVQAKAEQEAAQARFDEASLAYGQALLHVAGDASKLPPEAGQAKQAASDQLHRATRKASAAKRAVSRELSEQVQSAAQAIQKRDGLRDYGEALPKLKAEAPTLWRDYNESLNL